MNGSTLLPSPAMGSNESLAGVLTDVARELRAIRQLIEARGSHGRTEH